MSVVAGQVRVMLLREAAVRATDRAVKIGRHVESLYGAGGEPSPKLEATFRTACAAAEIAVLEYEYAMSQDAVARQEESQ